MGKTVTKVSVETTDETGKIETTHLHSGNVESIKWKNFGEQAGKITDAVLKGVAEGAE